MAGQQTLNLHIGVRIPVSQSVRLIRDRGVKDCTSDCRSEGCEFKSRRSRFGPVTQRAEYPPFKRGCIGSSPVWPIAPIAQVAERQIYTLKAPD